MESPSTTATEDNDRKLISLSDLHAKFGWEEYVVLFVTLSISGIIGVFWAWKSRHAQKTGNATSEYLLASRQMTLIPTTLSLACSFISAITLLGTPSEMYMHGTQYWVIGLSYPFVLAATAHLYLPVYHKFDFNGSAHEYLEKRFESRAVRLFAATCFILLTCLYLAIVVYAPSLALSQVTGLNIDLSIVLTFAVCIFYTSIGGIKAVIWTNVFQALCMLTSCLVVVVVGNNLVGGSGVVFRKSYEAGRIEIFNFDLSPLTRHTFWSQVIGGYFTWMTIYAVNQTMIQRYSTVKNLKTAKASIWLSGVAITIILSIVAYGGLVIFVHYQGCDPVKSGLVATKDQLLPLFVMDILADNNPGFPGFFVAGIFSGALSTVSGGLNSLAAVTLEDFIRPNWPKISKKSLNDLMTTRISKGLAIFYGVFSYVLTFFVQNIPGLVQAWLGIFGIFGGPVLGLFTLGMFIPWASGSAALISASVSLMTVLWIALGGNISRLNNFYHIPQLELDISNCKNTQWNITSNINAEAENNSPDPNHWWLHLPIYEISYMWYSGLACILVVFLGSVLSLIPRLKQKNEPNSDLLVPVMKDVLCCDLPSWSREPLENVWRKQARQGSVQASVNSSSKDM